MQVCIEDMGVRIVGANMPTANYMKVPELMKEIIIETERQDIDVLSHVSMVHSRFEKTHPFSDGNGRIGRLIMTAMLLRKNLPIAIIKQKNKSLYYKYIQKSQIQGELSVLEDFICDSVFDSFKIIKG